MSYWRNWDSAVMMEISRSHGTLFMSLVIFTAKKPKHPYMMKNTSDYKKSQNHMNINRIVDTVSYHIK